jgi:hypothetical protein
MLKRTLFVQFCKAKVGLNGDIKEQDPCKPSCSALADLIKSILTLGQLDFSITPRTKKLFKHQKFS